MRIARRMVLFCGVALVNILTTLLPIWPMRYRLLAYGLPQPIILGAQNITLFVGITMLLVAYPAAKGHRRAAQVLMSCAAAAVLANVIKGLDVEEATLNLCLFVILWRSRQSWHSIPLRYTTVDLLRLGCMLVLITAFYGLTGKTILHALHLMVERERDDFPQLHPIVHVLTAKLPLEHLWFDQSLNLLPLFLVGVFLIFSWTSLMNARTQYEGDDDLYQRFGRASHNSLAYLAHRNDVRRFVDSEGRGAITYRIVGHVALQIGAILAPPAERITVYKGFYDYCRSQHLIPAAVALAPEERPAARACGMRSITIGTEAIVDLTTFSMDRLAKKMRWVQRSLAKRGYSTNVLSAAEIPAQLRIKLDKIDAEWRAIRGGQEHGCCMTLGRFPNRTDADCLIGVTYDTEANPVAYLTLLPGGEGYYSLDLTRRAHDAPNAAMEFLMIEVLGALKERGATSVSLNFSTFSSLASTRGGNALLKLFGRAFQLGSLEAFNAKFRPNWAPRYAVFPSWLALPDVAYAIMQVEGVDRMAINACARAIRPYLDTTMDRMQRWRHQWRLSGEGTQGL